MYVDKISTKKDTLNLIWILADCKTIKHVISSGAEAETTTPFHNAKTSVPTR